MAEDKEYLLCAAIWFKDPEVMYVHQPKNVDNGYVIAGHRHHNCFATRKNLTDKMLEGADHVQGFLTNTNRFVDRKEAMLIAKQSGQVPTNQSFEELYSEDLY